MFCRQVLVLSAFLLALAGVARPAPVDDDPTPGATIDRCVVQFGCTGRGARS